MEIVRDLYQKIITWIILNMCSFRNTRKIDLKYEHINKSNEIIIIKIRSVVNRKLRSKNNTVYWNWFIFWGISMYPQRICTLEKVEEMVEYNNNSDGVWFMFWSKFIFLQRTIGFHKKWRKIRKFRT